ncbi:MAG: hypothetical protein JST00_43530 [Deltaproteobacteria bacterium]|nr:hypothetical protein [Deltaproteobacteria bacterium]
MTKFILAMEEFRRTEAGRVKNAKDLVDTFFPHDAQKATDNLFRHVPREVRAPIVAGWGIRGAKAALRDDDERIRSVVHDALLAGDIDETVFEEGVTAQTLVDWIPLSDWWAFWRSGKVSGVPVQKALQTARELGLFDDKWFLENVDGRGGRLKGTDTLCDTLSKDQIVTWLRNLHASGDGSPAGIVAALGWDVILAKTAQEALLFAVDAFARKVNLVAKPSEKPAAPDMTIRPDEVRGSEVPGIAIPDFPVEERGTDEAPASDRDAAAPPPESSWPEIASPGDMGYAIATGDPLAKPPKPSYNFDDDDEPTGQHNTQATANAPNKA